MSVVNFPSSPWADIPASGPMVRVAEAMRYLGLQRTTFYEEVRAGRLPQPVHLSPQTRGLPLAWLEAINTARAEASLG